MTRHAVVAGVALLSAMAPAAAGAPLAAQEQPARIALRATRLPKQLDGRAEVKRLIDSLVTARVLSMGYGVVPQDTTMNLSQRVIDSLGGLFDPVTGQIEQAKATTASQAVLAQLGTRFGAHYQLYPMVVPNTIPFRGSKAEWLGTEEETGGRGGLGGVILGTQAGRIGVLNFGVIVEDLTGNDVYREVAGIQLSNKLVGGKLVALPMDSLLTNQDRIASAVEHALRGLLEKVPVSRAN